MPIYVISTKVLPLMPTTEKKAKSLLINNKAKVIDKQVFTIQLLYPTTEYIQYLEHKVDTGSGKIGSAVADPKGNIYYVSEVEIRNDISKKMKQRSKYRRNRRNRKTRYRQPRWLNRGNSIRKDRFSPTMTSKINSHIKEIEFVKSTLPISQLILETGTFDPHALKNPNVLRNKKLYQKGTNYGFANTKAFVLDRDNHICQHCSGKSKDFKLEVHHIIFRTNGGSDEPENLIILCKTCHDGFHHGSIVLKLEGKRKGNLNHATQMNSIRVQLLKYYPNAIESFGYITKENRQQYTDQKEHYLDAVFIENNIKPVFKTNIVIVKKCVSDGDYQQTKGVRSQQEISTCKIQGFRKNDKVKYLGNIYFIKGKMKTGYAILGNIYGDNIDLKPIPKFNKMKRLNARKSWIISQKTVQNI